MRILYITARPPYPPHRGDQLIAYQQIRNLFLKGYELFLVSFIRNENEKEELEKELGSYCKKIFYVKINKLILILNSIKTLYNWKPLQVNMYTNILINRSISKVFLKVEPDLVHIQTVRLGELNINKRVPKVLDMIDILSLNMKRRAEKEKFFLRTVLNIESLLLKRYETISTLKYDSISIVSKNDLDKSHLNNTNIKVNPNGTYINREYLNKYGSIKKENIIIFHGNMSYFPNVEAMLYFTREIWPTIIDRYPDYKLYIVGKDPTSKITNLNNNNNIVVTGFVDDICEFLLRAKIAVYPLNAGTGMQNKILEALACGVPSVVSDYALQGIPDITLDEVMIANEKEEYIRAIENLINNSARRKKLIENGQSFIFKRYSWPKNADNLVKIWEDAIIHNIEHNGNA